jgi:hypothetical protein
MTRKAEKKNTRARTKKQMRMARGPTRKAATMRVTGPNKRTMKGGGLVTWFKAKMGHIESKFKNLFPRENTTKYLGINYCFRSELNIAEITGPLNATTNIPKNEDSKTWLVGDIKKFYDAGLLGYICKDEEPGSGNFDLHYKLGTNDTYMNFKALNASIYNPHTPGISKLKIFMWFPDTPFTNYMTEILKNSYPTVIGGKIVKCGTMKDYLAYLNTISVNKGPLGSSPGANALGQDMPKQYNYIQSVQSEKHIAHKSNRGKILSTYPAVKFAYDRKMCSIMKGYGPHETINWGGVGDLIFNILGSVIDIIDTSRGRYRYSYGGGRGPTTDIPQRPVTNSKNLLTVVAKNKYGFNEKFRADINLNNDQYSFNNSSTYDKQVFGLPTIYIQIPKQPTHVQAHQMHQQPNAASKLGACATSIAGRLRQESSITGTGLSFEVPNGLTVKILTQHDINNLIQTIIQDTTVQYIKVKLPFNTDAATENYILDTLNNPDNKAKIGAILSNLHVNNCNLTNTYAANTNYGLLFKVDYHGVQPVLYLATIKSNLISDHSQTNITQITPVNIADMFADVDFLIHLESAVNVWAKAKPNPHLM